MIRWTRFCSNRKQLGFLFSYLSKNQQRLYFRTNKQFNNLLDSTFHRPPNSLCSQPKSFYSIMNSPTPMHRTYLDPLVFFVTATLNQSTRMLEVSYTEVISSDDSRTLTESFPFAWLRDSCRCPECHHPSTHSRRISLLKFDPNCRPKSVEVCFKLFHNIFTPLLYY